MATKIEQFNRPTLRVLSAEANAALAKVAAEFGLTFETKAGSYSDTEFNFKATFKLNTTQAIQRIEQRTASVAQLLGLPEDVVGKTFYSNGVMFTVTGLNLKRRKYPVSATNANGTGYKFSEAEVKRCLNVK